MKLMNYDKRTLILQHVKPVEKRELPLPDTYSKAQYNLLCSIIRRHHITEPFFKLLLSSLYDLEDWKELNYSQMYELISILINFNYEKVRI